MSSLVQGTKREEIGYKPEGLYRAGSHTLKGGTTARVLKVSLRAHTRALLEMSQNTGGLNQLVLLGKVGKDRENGQEVPSSVFALCILMVESKRKSAGKCNWEM